MVPHRRLLNKLYHYGIDANIHKWISSFLTNRTQRIMVHGEFSDPADVISGVLQGTILGPLLFLLFINDLPFHVSSQTRLFADDCLLYWAIRGPEDQIELQRHLSALEAWTVKWGMSFNALKYNVIRVTRGKQVHSFMYRLGGHILEEVQSTKYLGVNISNNLG